MADKIEGYLEVGLNDDCEIVVNHPDLKPNENGVGHIVFSVNQARYLADLLNRKAREAETELVRRDAEAKMKLAAVVPVELTARVLTNGMTEEEMPDYQEVDSTGQQKAYVVLSAEERAKGFVRPVRSSYKHVGRPGPQHPLRDMTPDEHERYDEYGYVKFEEYPAGSHSSGRFWQQEQLDKVGKGCQSVTTMGQAIAETYARSPGFYGGTFCATCGDHFPVGRDGEFVWVDDGERVGT